MPIHDWSRVSTGIFHDFLLCCYVELSRSLNNGLLPDDLYAMVERHEFQEDMLFDDEEEAYRRKRHTIAVHQSNDFQCGKAVRLLLAWSIHLMYSKSPSEEEPQAPKLRLRRNFVVLVSALILAVVAVLTNPDREKHAAWRQMTQSSKAGVAGEYHNYVFFSTTTGGEGDPRVSVGCFGFVRNLAW